MMVCMDFKTVLETLIAGMEARSVRHALIGGFALGVLGVPRSTMDLDFLVHRDDLHDVHDLLGGLGYERFLCTENVSQYTHSEAQWGAVDVLHAFREYSLAMLDRSSCRELTSGLKVRVLEPEDVIGLKVQAVANDPARGPQEWVDIESLLKVYNGRMDWQRLGVYFDLFDMRAKFSELQESFSDAE